MVMADSSSSSSSASNTSNVDFKEKYKCLKRKLKNLIYENEYFHETLRQNQRKFLKATQDRNFLLERLAKYEPPEFTSSDTDKTESSDDEVDRNAKRIKIDTSVRRPSMTPPPSTSKFNGIPKKKKVQQQSITTVTVVPSSDINVDTATVLENDDDKCSIESNKQSVTSTKECITVTTEMLSDDGSVDNKMSPEIYDVVES